ncbi:MAG: hypothetical protein ACK531_13460, partial [Cyanobacteriota bacterium]
MDTPSPDWIPDGSRHTYPGWVQRKAVTLCKRDQKRGGSGNVQQYRLAIHQAVLASEGRDHWTGEWLAWDLIGTYDTREADGNGEHKKQFAMLPTIDHRSNQPEPDFVICAWRTNDAKHDMTPQELLAFCTAVLNHSPNWAAAWSLAALGGLVAERLRRHGGALEAMHLQRRANRLQRQPQPPGHRADHLAGRPG